MARLLFICAWYHAPSLPDPTPTTPDFAALVDPPGRWRALFVLAGSSVLSMGAWFSASAVLPQLRALWHLSSATGALMTISMQLGFVAGCLAFVYPPGLKAMATWFRRGRGTALGTLVGGLTLGSAIPHLLNALGGLDWRMVILGTSFLTLLGGFLAEFGTTDGPFPFPRAVFNPAQILASFARRGVRLATLGYFAHMWELYAMWTWFAAFFADVLRAHGLLHFQRDASFAAFAVIGAGAFGCWAGGRLGDSWGRTRTAALAMAVS